MSLDVLQKFVLGFSFGSAFELVNDMPEIVLFEDTVTSLDHH